MSAFVNKRCARPVPPENRHGRSENGDAAAFAGIAFGMCALALFVALAFVLR